MRLRQEAFYGIGTLAVLQLTTSVIATALLLRMSPAIDQILADNVYSQHAVEEMLAVLAAPELSPALMEQFQLALGRAAGNVTEAAEPELLIVIERVAPAALEGDAPARTTLIASLQELGRVNRESMIEADLRAQRIGFSGAWAAAIAGCLGFWLALVVFQRMRLRIELPIADGMSALQGARNGDALVRWNVSAAPAELRQIAHAVNQLLESRLLARAAHDSGPGTGMPSDTDLRRMLLLTMDRISHAVVILGHDGGIVAANQTALDRNPRLLALRANTESNAEGLTCLQVPESPYRLVIDTLPPTKDDSHST